MKASIFLALICAFAAGVATGVTGSRRHSDDPRKPAEAVSAASPTAKPQAKPVVFASATGNKAFNLQNWIAEVQRECMGADHDRKWLKINRMVMALPDAEIPRAVAEWEPLVVKMPSLRMVQQQLIMRWAELDPKAVVAYGAGLKAQQGRQAAIIAGLSEWTRQDPDGAWAWVQSAKAGADKRQYMQSYVTALAGVDPDKAMEKLNLAPANQRQQLMDQILVSLAAKDPVRAADMALQRGGAMIRRFGNNGLSGVLSRWMTDDPGAAVSWMKANSDAIMKQSNLIGSLGSMAYQAPEAVMQIFDALPKGRQRKMLLQQAMNAMESQDPELLKRWSALVSDSEDKNIIQSAYAMAMARENPAAALPLVASIAFSEQNGWRLNQIFSEMASSNPQNAMQSALSLTNSAARQQALQGVYNSWAQEDPSAAGASALTLTNGVSRKNAVQAVANALNERDAKAALEFVKQLPNSAMRSEIVQNMLYSTMHESPEQTAQYLNLIPAGEKQNQMVRQIASSWSGQNFDAALEWAKTLPEGSARNSALSGMSSAWAENDPESALKFASSLPSGNARRDMYNQIASQLGQKDPASAMQLVSNLPDDAPKKDMMRSLFGMISWRDPESAIQLASTLTTGRDEVYSQIASSWAGQDPTAVVAWAGNLPAGRNRTEIVANALGQWAAQAPAEAATYVSRMSGEEQERGVQSVISSMAHNDPSYASQWISQFPEGKMKDQAQESLVSQWAHSDPTAAAGYLTSLPAGESRERIVNNFVSSVSYQDPKLAWTWAQTIGNQNMASMAMENAARNWMRNNEAEARAAIQSSSLAEETKKRLLKSE